MKITFDDARDYVIQERKLIHAWATKHPFAFAGIVLAVEVALAWVI